MDEFFKALPLVGGGILGVTLIDTVGAVASRRLQFNYGYLTLLSLAVYFLIGYYGAGIAANKTVLLASLIVGSYDATIGFKLSKLCKPNLGSFEEDMKKVTYAHALLMMAIIGPLFSGIGYAVHSN